MSDTQPVQMSQDEHVVASLRTPLKYPKPVLRPSYESGQFDSHAVDGAFVFRHEDHFRMTYLGWDGIGYQTGWAKSYDLLNWTKQGLLVGRGGAGSVNEFNIALTWILRENDLFGSGRLKQINGRYLGTYHAYPQPGYEIGPASIGLCWSDDLLNWHLEQPVLYTHDGGAWEHGSLYKSCLIEDSGVYYLFYNAKNRDVWPWREEIGVAMSRDFVHWQRHEYNPVLRVGPQGAFDELFVSEPCVLKYDDLWVMFYFGLSTDSHSRNSIAISEDLITWHRTDEILVDVGLPEEKDSVSAHKPAIFYHAGCLYHYYTGVAARPAGASEVIDHQESRLILVSTSKPVV